MHQNQPVCVNKISINLQYLIH